VERKRGSAQHQEKRGGRAINKMSRSNRWREAEVVSRNERKEHHPGCVNFFLGCALLRLRFAGGFAKFC
jgi:hypothetical protein